MFQSMEFHGHRVANMFDRNNDVFQSGQTCYMPTAVVSKFHLLYIHHTMVLYCQSILDIQMGV